jgi:hypothetical protein
VLTRSSNLMAILTNPDEIVKHENACCDAHYEDDEVDVVLGADYDRSMRGRATEEKGVNMTHCNSASMRYGWVRCQAVTRCPGQIIPYISMHL